MVVVKILKPSQEKLLRNQNNNMAKVKEQKEYKVGLFYEVGGYTYIKAKSQKEANQIGVDKLNEVGEKAIKDVTHRDMLNV